MSDRQHESVDERFVEFLLTAAADYNRPPEPPREEMWSRIEESVLEPSLSRIGADYNQPPETPREEMWSRIQAAWQFRASAPETVRDAGFEPLAPVDVAPVDVAEVGKARRASRITPWAWGLAVAASLTIGVVIGRQSMGEPETGRTVADAMQQPVRPEGVDAVRTDAAGAAADGGDLAGADLASADPATVPVTRGTETASLQPEAASDQRIRGAVTHKAATVQHLTRTETFLTTLRTGTEPNENGQVSKWARSLLADTRLLLDWPVERDPRMTVLLQELELLLAQIAQLGGAVPDGERSLIMEDLETNNVLPRLRSAIPAGRVAVTQSGV